MKAAERKAKELFEVAVMAKAPLCVVCGWRRADDPHHVIPKSALRALHPGMLGLGARGMDREAVAQRRMELAWDPRNGEPVCRVCHGPLTTKALYLTPEQVYPEVVAFAIENRLEHLLEREVPGLRIGGSR